MWDVRTGHGGAALKGRSASFRRLFSPDGKTWPRRRLPRTRWQVKFGTHHLEERAHVNHGTSPVTRVCFSPGRQDPVRRGAEFCSGTPFSTPWWRRERCGAEKIGPRPDRTVPFRAKRSKKRPPDAQERTSFMALWELVPLSFRAETARCDPDELYLFNHPRASAHGRHQGCGKTAWPEQNLAPPGGGSAVGG